MPATSIDSAVFRDIFSTEAMRRVFSDENRVQKYLDFEAALARAQLASDALMAIATIAAKQNEAGIIAAAAKLGLSVVSVSDADLRAAGLRTQTRSPRVLALKGVPSVAEAAALAAAGPSGRLISPRLVRGSATCALAAAEAAP